MFSQNLLGFYIICQGCEWLNCNAKLLMLLIITCDICYCGNNNTLSLYRCQDQDQITIPSHLWENVKSLFSLSCTHHASICVHKSSFVFSKMANECTLQKHFFKIFINLNMF